MKRAASLTRPSLAVVIILNTSILCASFRVSEAQTPAIHIAPSSVADSVLRGRAGAFGAPRADGKKHSGVDIVSRQTAMDKTPYKVFAVSEGKIAYVGFNGDVNKGYGYTVIVDHGNNLYTLYAHLATLASAGLAKVGQSVEQGAVLGYMADLAHGEKSSGNVLAEVVGKYDKIQLHFELFQAPSGRSSTGMISDVKQLDFQLIDPTDQVKSFGYSVYSD